MAKEPIVFDTEPLGLPSMKVLVVGARTEEEIAADLRSHFRTSGNAGGAS
jgi:hypothetical protein